MEIVTIEEKAIYGFVIRTTNENEMNPKTTKIGEVWQRFDREVTVDYEHGERVYGVYYNYESNADGEFDVLAGYEKDEGTLDKVVIQHGKYLCFEGKAKSTDERARIQAVIEIWEGIWAYFNEKPAYKRAYSTDFEFYKNQTDVAIYISVI